MAVRTFQWLLMWLAKNSPVRIAHELARAALALRILKALSVALGIVSLVACSPTDRASPTNDSHAILLFSGDGTSPNDVAALETILDDNHFGYTRVNSRQLNAMSKAQLRAYRLLIVPGGNFEQIGSGLTPSTTATIRDSVQGGLNYLVICAGAFFAGNSPYNGSISPAAFFYVPQGREVRKATVAVAVVGSSTFDYC